MVPPFLSNHVPAVDVDFVTFINEFLFNPPPQVSSARSTLRHQRTPPRPKRYRTTWRAAATSLMKKRSSDEPLRKLPLGVSLDEGHSFQATHFSSVDQVVIKLPSQVFLDDEQATSADQLLSNLASQASLDYGGGLDTIDSQHHNTDRIDVDEAPLITPACSKSKKTGSASGCCSKAQPFEATSTPAIPKHSSRKPPRPPRASVSRSGSSRAIGLKTAARRAVVDNARMRKQKLPKSTSSAMSMWALIITLCFASIMIVQGFLGNNSKDFDSKAEGQPVGEGVSSVSPYSGIPPFASENSTQTLVAEHGHGAGTSLDKLQKVPRDLPFMNLRLRKLRATPWLLL